MVILDNFPLWIVFIGGVIVLVLAYELGFRVGLWTRIRFPEVEEIKITGTLVGGILGLMAFLLALSINTVVNQHNARKAMVVTEANAIGTAYLRAEFLEEPDRIFTRDLLREYIEVRLEAAADPAKLDSVIERSEAIQSQLWTVVAENFWMGRDSDTMALFVESINEVIDVHTLRLTAAEMRLPRRYGIMLIMATILSFLLTGIASSNEKKRAYIPVLLFALAFVAIFMIIVDLDRPQQGFVTVSQQAMTDLLRQISSFGS